MLKRAIRFLPILFFVYALYCCGMWLDEKYIVQMSEKLASPGILCSAECSEPNINTWIGEKAMAFFPLRKYVDTSVIVSEQEDVLTRQMMLAMQTKEEQTEKTKDISYGKLNNFDYLLSHFYTVDSNTSVKKEWFCAEEMLGKDMTLDEKSEGPKVLIFHTHSQEAFKDSKAGDSSETVVGMGQILADKLNSKGIENIHHDGVYDLIDGKLDRSKAYQMAEEGVKEILKKYPSIEVVIDLHRDGVSEKTRLVTEINGKNTAKIMFFNGLSRTKTNGDIEYLYNPHIKDNLAFSLQMQLASEKLYPGFARKIYLKAYRYSLHMKPKSLLIEAGAQNNTVKEMENAMDLLSNVLCEVLKK